MRLVNIARKYKGLSLGGIKAKFDSVDKTISLPTIVKLLGRYGIARWHQRRKIYLTQKNKDKRVAFCRNFLKSYHEDGDQYPPFMCTDETYIRMIPDHPGFLYCRREDLDKDEYLYRFVKFGSVQIMCWAGVWKGGRTEIMIQN